MLAIALLALLVFVSVVVRLAERVRPDGAHRDESPAPAVRAWHAVQQRRVARRALPLLPEGHRPPAALGPLSPSERFLTTEAARGIAALQQWLREQAGPATA